MGNRLLFFLILVLAGLIFSTGVVFIAMYAWNGVIVRLGEPDQSLLFWYLPILFLGIICAAGGWAMAAWGWERFQKLSSPDS